MSLTDKREQLFREDKDKKGARASELFREKPSKEKVTKASELFPPALSIQPELTTAPPSSLEVETLPSEGVSAFKSVKELFGLTKPKDLPDLITSAERELAEAEEERGKLAGFFRVEPDKELERRRTVERGANIIRIERLKRRIKGFELRPPTAGPGDTLPASELFPPREFEEVIRPRRFMEDTILQRSADELQRVVGRGVAGITGGLSDLAIQAITGKEPDLPVTIPGVVAGAAAELGGFLTGPLSLSKALIAGRVSIPGVSKFRQMADLVVRGAAELGLAGGLADIAPAFMRSDSFTEMGISVLKSTALTSIIGGMFPISSLIPTKPVRIASMMAVMDMIRAPENNLFTVDDVAKGIVDGTIDKEELAERSFGYLIDLYFSAKVPSRAKLLKTFESNRLIKEITKEFENVDRIEKDVAFINENLSKSLFERVEIPAEITPVDVILGEKVSTPKILRDKANTDRLTAIAEGGRINVFHGKFSKVETGKAFGGIHVGSKRAANERLNEVAKRNIQNLGPIQGRRLNESQLGKRQVTELSIPVEKIFAIKEPLSELQSTVDSKGVTRESLFLYANIFKLLKGIKDRGFTAIAYKNIAEDPGSISYLILKESIMKQAVVERTPTLKRAEKEPSPANAREERLIEQAVKDTKPIIGTRQVHTAPDGTIKEGPDPKGATTRTIKTHPADKVLREVGDQIVLDKPESKDIAVFAEWIMSPEFVLRDNPKAQKLAGNIIEGELLGSFNISKDRAFFNESKHLISKEQQRKITDHLRKIMDGKEGLKLTEEEQTAANGLREWFDSVREDIKIHKRAMYKRYLPDNEARAFLEVIKGGDAATALAKNKVESERLLDLVTDYKSIDKWGLDDYITNMERGTYKMINPEGTTVLVGITRKDAVDKAVVYLKANPTVRTLQLDTSAPREAGLSTELSRGQYFAIRGRLEKAMESDIDFINKEIASAAAKESLKGLLVIKPSFKFAGPLIRRKGILAGEDNIYDVLPAYSSSIRKKISLDPIIADVRAELHRFPINVQNLLVSQMDYAKGRYAFGDKAVDNLTGKLGMKPMLWTRSVQLARKVEANLKLGLRPVAAFVNLAGGQAHTLTKVGFKYLREAHKFIKTEEGKKFIVQEQAYLGMDFAIDIEGSVSTRQNWYNPLKLFQMPEVINRETSLAGNYLLAKGEMGMTDIAAREYARQAVRFQQFTYNVASLPRMLRSPGGKLVGQFKTYLVKELEFISTLRGVEIARYVGSFLALGGPRAVVYMMRSLPIIGAYVGWDKIEEMMDEVAPRLTRGVPGVIGTDITAPAVIQLPSEPADWGGPFLSDLHDLVAKVLVPVMEGEDFITENAMEWAKNLAPIANYWDKLLDSVMDKDGWIKDRFGRKVYQVSNWYDKLLLSVGAPPLELARQTALLGIIAREEDILSRNQRKVTRRIIRNILDESAGGFDSDDIDDLVRYKVTKGMIESTLKSMELSSKQRALLRARKAEKLRVFELLNQ